MRALILFSCLLLTASLLHAQSTTIVTDSLTSVLSEKYLNKVNNKISALNKGIERKTLKMLEHLEKQEGEIQKKLSKKDSIAAQLSNVKDRYTTLKEQIRKPISNTHLKEYIPEFDSLKTGLSFLKQSGFLTSNMPAEWNDKLKSVNTNVADFESRLQ